jgi:hypothetical protein
MAYDICSNFDDWLNRLDFNIFGKKRESGESLSLGWDSKVF